MSAPTRSGHTLYLPGVEENPQPGASGGPEVSTDNHRQQEKTLASRGYVRD
jgi:hypothetical protein